MGLPIAGRWFEHAKSLPTSRCSGSLTSSSSIGLWESATGTLFSGDAIYDGHLLDELADSNIIDYCATMKRLLELPVEVVHAGHDPSFGRAKLRHIAQNYLDKRS